MPCPICNGQAQRLFSKAGYWIRGCADCGHRFVEGPLPEDHVQRVYGDDYFEGGGAGYSGYSSEAELLRDAGRKYGRLLKRHMQPGALLAAGPAGGFQLQGFVDEGFEGHGVEPNPRMAAHAREHLGLAVSTGTLEQFRVDRQYRVVTMIQVAPHFFDLRRAFQTAAEATEPAGFWLIETWNARSWTARCWGRHWHEYSPPSVLHWFSPESLRRLAAQFGFHEIARGRPAKRIGAGHAKSLLQYKLGHTGAGRVLGGLVRLIPDRLTIPYPGDDLFWALFRR